MAKKQPFRDADEKDELRWEIERLVTTGRALEKLRADPAFATYRLISTDAALPLLPTQNELTAAKDVMLRSAECLVHYYNLRRRWDDDELTVSAERPSFEQDNDTPF